MSILEVIFIGIGLSMDAFAVAVCKGLSMKNIKIKNFIIIGLYFGFFQFLMPVIGYFLGNGFEKIVQSVAHWIAFLALLIIGSGMISDSSEENNNDDKINFKTMIFLAIATSIDALAVGITFAFYDVNIFYSALFIGIITFSLSIIGCFIGHKFGDKFKNKAEIFGGIILILIGIKILLEDLNIISFNFLVYK